MKDLKTKAIESSVTSIVSLIVGAIGASILWLFSDIPSAILSIFSTLSNKVLIKLSIGLFAVCLLEAVWIYSRRTKLKPCFGILWDKGSNPYCPSCKKSLVNYGTYADASGFYDRGFQCLACNKMVFLRGNQNMKKDLQAVQSYVRENLFHDKESRKSPDIVV